MKIALFNNLYGKYSHGGAETVVRLLAEKLQREGQEVFLITTKPRGQAKPAPAPDGLKIYYLNSYFYNLKNLPLFIRLFWHIGSIFSIHKYSQIKKILVSERPDLILTHNLTGLGYLAPLAIKQQKIRQEHFLHDIQLLHPSGLMLWGKEKIINSLAAKIYQTLTRNLFASPAKVSSPSVWLLKIHTERGFFKNSEKVAEPFAWPTGETPRREKKPAGLRNFLFIGQIERQKGVFLLINAFKKIKDKNLRLTFAIRNGGQDLSATKKLARDDERIKFLGPLSYAETENLKNVSDCLIVPSLCYENSPTTIYGAHACGLPVIAARIGGIPEIMDESDNLFEPGNEDDLRKKIIEMAKI